MKVGLGMKGKNHDEEMLSCGGKQLDRVTICTGMCHKSESET